MIIMFFVTNISKILCTYGQLWILEADTRCLLSGVILLFTDTACTRTSIELWDRLFCVVRRVCRVGAADSVGGFPEYWGFSLRLTTFLGYCWVRGGGGVIVYVYIQRVVHKSSIFINVLTKNGKNIKQRPVHLSTREGWILDYSQTVSSQ